MSEIVAEFVGNPVIQTTKKRASRTSRKRQRTEAQETVSHLGVFLRMARQHKNYSLQQLAKRARIHITDIRKAESGRDSLIKSEVLKKVAKILNIQIPEQLLTEKYVTFRKITIRRPEQTNLGWAKSKNNAHDNKCEEWEIKIVSDTILSPDTTTKTAYWKAEEAIIKLLALQGQGYQIHLVKDGETALLTLW